MPTSYTLSINGTQAEVSCDPSRSLLDVLREDLRLTGTKRGCDIGACGSCTVLVNGKPKRACIIKMRDLPSSEAEITTIEGLEQDGKLHPIQQAFIDCGAIQCGFCTPGMVLTAKALLDANPNPTREQIKRALKGNLCRCTGYQQIFEAIECAAKNMRDRREKRPACRQAGTSEKGADRRH
ncbi:MAG: (2Fe-2S)-binding protein [Pseudomonadota bacterium]